MVKIEYVGKKSLKLKKYPDSNRISRKITFHRKDRNKIWRDSLGKIESIQKISIKSKNKGTPSVALSWVHGQHHALLVFYFICIYLNWDSPAYKFFSVFLFSFLLPALESFANYYFIVFSSVKTVSGSCNIKIFFFDFWSCAIYRV